MKYGEWVKGTNTGPSHWARSDSHRAWSVCIRNDFWGAAVYSEDFRRLFGGNDVYPVHAARKIFPDFDKIAALGDDELEALRAMCSNDSKEWVLFTAALVAREIEKGKKP